MIKKVLDAVEKHRLFEASHRVTVALSGGADSMALLHILLEIRDRFGLTVTAAHLNHCLRGAESDRDEAFVRDACVRLQVPLTVEHADVSGYAAQHKLSTELAARELRYDFLRRINPGLVATAHTASDNLETVLLNLVRGTGLPGLCGIPVKRDIFIRPLIFCTRGDVEEYCERNSISFVTDSTNLNDDYTRNRIRHGIVPALKAINPSVENAVGRMTELLKDDAEYLDKAALNEFEKRFSDGKLDIFGFSEPRNAVFSRVICRFLENTAEKQDYLHTTGVLALAKKGSGQYEISGGRRVVCRNHTLRFDSDDGEKTEISVHFTEESAETIKKDGKINNLLLKNAIDCDKIVGIVRVRTRQPGDTLTLKHRGVTKTLKNLFNEEHIPEALRDRIPVIADDAGVLWVYGFGVNKRVCPDGQTEKILFVRTDEKKRGDREC